MTKVLTNQSMFMSLLASPCLCNLKMSGVKYIICPPLSSGCGDCSAEAGPGLERSPWHHKPRAWVSPGNSNLVRSALSRSVRPQMFNLIMEGKTELLNKGLLIHVFAFTNV